VGPPTAVAPPARPGRLVLVVGTGTGVGKTWVAARLLGLLSSAGHLVAARKPVQSFDLDVPPDATDAAVLARATGERPEEVCDPAGSFELPMAPPMAAEALGRPSFAVADLAAGLRWAPGTTLGLVEAAGGVASPMAADGDATDLAAALRPDVVLLVADAGLGVLNAVRLAAGALGHPPARRGAVHPAGARRTGQRDGALVVVLNRFDAADDLHRRNLDWLRDRDGYDAVVLPGDEEALCRRVLGTPTPAPGGAAPGCGAPA